MLDFCTEELTEKLTEPRKTLFALEEAKVGLKEDEKGKGGAEGVKTLETSTLAEHRESEAMDVDSSATSSSVNKAEPEIPTAPQVTGLYDLVAVLTHKGRSADSGHYISWVKQDNGKWIEFDDEEPPSVPGFLLWAIP